MTDSRFLDGPPFGTGPSPWHEVLRRQPTRRPLLRVRVRRLTIVVEGRCRNHQPPHEFTMKSPGVLIQADTRNNRHLFFMPIPWGTKMTPSDSGTSVYRRWLYWDRLLRIGAVGAAMLVVSLGLLVPYAFTGIEVLLIIARFLDGAAWIILVTLIALLFLDARKRKSQK
jgi:hypothetical protein